MLDIHVVYFDACVCMVENDEKHSKIIEKVPFPSWIREAHVRLMKCFTLQEIFLHLFAQDWPSLCWGRFNDDEVDSINWLLSSHPLLTFHRFPFEKRGKQKKAVI